MLSLKIARTLFVSAAVAMSSWVSVAHADAMGALDNYIRTAKSGSMAFTQNVSHIQKGGKGRQSSGTFAFQRPSQFRFDYTKPFAQTLVADGKNLWMHDVALKQVTQRSQAQVLDATPAALVASATSIASLQQRFTLSNEADTDGLQWVKAVPKDTSGQIKLVRIGFEGQNLRKLVIDDSFGQRSTITFGAMTALSGNTRFTFTPPKGVTVLKQ